MRMVGLDIGDVRIGIAVCDEREIIASGVETYRRTGDLDQDCAYIADRVRELSAERVVLGLPINMNGTQGPACEKVRAFGEALSIRCPVEQDYFDERLTSAQANRVLISADVSRKKRKNVVDMLAAQLILQAYIDARC
ncbi:Holliday junction resolvase RuvX [Christensenella sp. MSJ-20]|uniref:Holliday junction resolvase RuvX n=1 Tax=Christensenella sp. MSJ-20 TaxID=2841518 RepID=UPI001C7769B8|nr:Holliday junction resolvase RuvX [Christensenella sp. MSJ-20]